MPTAENDFRTQINLANDKLMACLGDPVAMREIYTHNARILPPHAPMIALPQDQRKFEDWAQGQTPGLNIETLELERFGNAVVEVGLYTMYSPDGRQIADEGKYLIVWKLVDGNWKIHRDMYGSSLVTDCNSGAN